MGACTTTPGKLMICSELMVNDLETLLFDASVQLSLLVRMRMARDAALGMTWLHSSNPVIVHRDLKSSNLLIDEHMRVKVCDFGLSQLKPRGQSLLDSEDGAKGTPLWMAPEILSGKEFDEKADVYSFGLILWQILTRLELFPEQDNISTFARELVKKNMRPPIPPETNPKLATLIRRLWHATPASRPPFSQVVQLIDEVITELAIHDAAARAWWTGAFGFVEHVPWRDFLNSFATATGLVPVGVSAHDALVYEPHTLPPDAETALKCFKALLVAPASSQQPQLETVSMEKFGNVVAWFGRFKAEGSRIPFNVRSAAMHEWFHGDVTTSEAEDRLADKPAGTFLVRFSSSEPGAFTISKVSSFGAIAHQRIIHPAGEPAFTINSCTYARLDELVEAQREPLNLIQACPGSRFLSLIAKVNIQGYIPS
jgi:hypothetical protein